MVKSRIPASEVRRSMVTPVWPACPGKCHRDVIPWRYRTRFIAATPDGTVIPMRIAIIVNSVHGGKTGHTTYGLARRLSSMGHEVWVAGTGGFALEPDGRTRLFAHRVRDAKFRSALRYLAALRAREAYREWIEVEQLDGLFLRFNPFSLEGWALSTVLDFARRAADAGVVVLNDAHGLSRATSKLYLQEFPEEIRPRTLITRRRSRIERFLDEQERIVLKPLRGYGGRNVFLATNDSRVNLAQILSVMTQDGFVVAQEYLPAAEEGDVRLFLLDGEPVVRKGQYAVVRRMGAPGGFLNNVQSGGEARPTPMTDDLHRIAAGLRPRLQADGMFFVGVDVAGDKVLEINVFSPGGLHALRDLQRVDFFPVVARAIERRLAGSRTS